MVIPCISLKTFWANLFSQIFIPSVNPNILRCSSSTALSVLSVPTPHQKNCNRYWLWYTLPYPCNHYYLPRLPCIPTSSAPVSTSRHWLSMHCSKQYWLYANPVLKWLWYFQNSSPPQKPNPQGWYPDFYKNNDGEITLNLTASIKKLRPILSDFHNIYPSKYLLHLIVNSMVEILHEKSW